MSIEGNSETLLDARGLMCPMPLLKAKQTLNKMQAGGRLRVLATDSGSQRDFKVFAAQSGHELLESTEKLGQDEKIEHYIYVLKKRSIG